MSTASSKIFKAGTILFKEGDPSRSIYILKRGGISIRKKKSADKFVEVAKIPSGEVIGELSFFDRLPRSATAVALVETEVHEIPFESLEKIYQGIPDFMKTFVVTLADRLRKANEQVKQLRASRQWDDAGSVEFSSETQVDPNKN